MYLSLRSRLSLRASLAVTAVFAFATPVWSVSADALWTHPVTIVGCAGAAWALSRNRFGIAGLFFAAGILARAHVALIALVVGVGLSLSRRSLRPMMQLGSTSLLGVASLVLWNHYLSGSWGLEAGQGKAVSDVVPGYDSGLWSYLQNVAGFLVSPDRGLLIWTPCVLVLLPAVMRSWKHIPDWARWLAWGGGLYTVVQVAMVRDFGGGDGFYGYRYALELLTCVTPVLAFALPNTGTWARRLLPPVLGYQFAVIALGAIYDGYWVAYRDAWRDSSVALALRDDPVRAGIVLVLVGLGAAWISHRCLTAPESSAANGAQGRTKIPTRLT
jgi:alpha-1,2-mannosyltransferase